MNAIAQVLTRMEEADGRLDPLWGPSYDPLRSLRLRVRWIDLTDGNVVENAFYSTLQPLQTRPTSWLIQAAYHKIDPEDVPRAEANSHAHDDASSSTSGDHQPRYLETLALGGIVKQLLAGYVVSQAVKPGTLLAELGRATTTSKDEEEDGEDATALTIASLLAPEMVQAVKSMQARPRVLPPNPSNLTMVSFLLDGRSKGGAMEDDDDENMNVAPSLGPRKLDRWFPKMGSPVGGLVSLLALMMGTRESLWAMARLWAEVVRELRWRWDQAEEEEHVKGLVKLVGVGAGASNEPDLSACLLQQKLHVLDLCMRRRGMGPTEGAAQPPPTSPEFSSPLRLSHEKRPDDEDDEDFYDTVGEEPREREGALYPAQHGRLKLLKTGATAWVPACQKHCPVTEDEWLQQSQLLQRVEKDDAENGSTSTASTLTLQERVRCQLQMAPLVSDMQAFKAANPEGAVLADFVRWKYPEAWVADTDHVPPEYGEEAEEEEEDDVKLVWEGSGYVDPRLFALTHSDRTELARLWRGAKPIAASKQKPLFNLPQEAEKVRSKTRIKKG